MKYLPLVWSALRRKPAEAMLTWLAITAAFTLFGLMMGLRVTYDHLIESSRMDRLDVNARFPSASPTGILLPVALRGQIARIEGVAAVGTYFWLWGHYQQPDRTARVIAVDDHMRAAWSELPLTAAQWSRLSATPTGVFVSRSPARRLGLRTGDAFPLITPPGMRADRTSTWQFQVLGIVPDDPRIGAFILGNLRYVEESRPLPDRGLAMGFRVAVRHAARAEAVSLRIDGHFANSTTPTITIPDKTNMIYAAHSGFSTARIVWPVAAAGIFVILLLTATGIAQSVRERWVEFAVLQTVGFRVRVIMGLVLAEALAPCLAGAILGTALAAALSRLPMHYLPPHLGDIPEPAVSAQVLAGSLACALGVAVASAAIPLLSLRRLRVTDVLAGR